MSTSSKRRMLVLCTYLGPVAFGLAGFAAPVGAQNAAAPAVSQSDTFTASATAVSATQGANSVADEELRNRVQAALHSDPYFYDQHVGVSVENGVVVLRGFVFSGWDLRDAMRIARRAADKRLVVDDLSIEVGGRR
jgi:osmotically-inducible protein OsmY